MRLRFLAPLAFLSLIAGCQSNRPTETAATPVVSPQELALEEARALLQEGSPESALIALDGALDISGAERKAEVQFLRGVATLKMGTEAGNAFFFEDARRAFLEATGPRPASWFGAARATWMQFFQTSDQQTLDEALGFVRTGFQMRDEQRRGEEYFEHSPERTRGEIAFSAYTHAKGQELSETRINEMFELALDSLEAEIGRAPTDSWGWTQVANLYLWEGRNLDARTTMASALKLNPDDATLHESNVRIIEQDGGWKEVIRLYSEFVEQHDGNALGHWYLGKAYYDFAVDSMLGNREDRSIEFLAAAKHLKRSREIEPSYTESCKGFEVISRNGLGWSHFYAGRTSEAEVAWWSMEEFTEGGLQWELKDRMFSGLDSLAFAVAAYNSKWVEGLAGGTAESYSQGFPNLRRAADLAFKMFKYAPEDWNRANNAGYFTRDLGVQLERQGVIALGASEERAEQLFKLTNEYMEKSMEAYVVAARLAPTDARTVNDAGLILTYYLQRDLEQAQKYLEDAIRVGQVQLKQGISDSDERDSVTTAVGDAYQNLGVLALTLRGDAASALTFFEKSLSYEVEERWEVRQSYLPACNKVIQGEIDPSLVIEAYKWGNLSTATVQAREAAKVKLDAARSDS